MEEKYYTPDIEELHVGFELQDDTAVGDWTERIIKDPEYLRTISHRTKQIDNLGKITYNLTKVCRVKYLDKKDIESLGWQFKESLNSYNVFYIKHVEKDKYDDYVGFYYKLFYSEKYHLLTIEKLRINEFSGEECYDLYEGNQNHIVRGIKIKNKSELKRLLKQLNINNG